MDDLVCRSCRATYLFDDPRWRCDCGSLLDIRFRAAFDRDRILERRPTMWRYREALPIHDEKHIVSFDEGFTPLLEAHIHGKPVWLKQEHLFPTGSYKDRGASVLVSRAAELGVSRVVEDSSGNAGAAIAAYAARAGVACDIYVPESTSPAKLVQIRMYRAQLHEVPGSRENTAHAALQAAGQHFYASHVWNPFFFQGTKTFAFEVWEQLGFRAPDTVLIPTGNGTLFIGAYIGFEDLKAAGLIQRLPKLIAVQSENCAPIYRMWTEGLEDLPSLRTSDTIAEGIAIAEPMRARQIIDIVRETEGVVVTVSDEEIEIALVDACRQGWYVEPTSASALAALRTYPLSEGETIVAPLTGHGLKSTEKLLQLAGH